MTGTVDDPGSLFLLAFLPSGVVPSSLASVLSSRWSYFLPLLASLPVVYRRFLFLPWTGRFQFVVSSFNRNFAAPSSTSVPAFPIQTSLLC
jgi:hypothetical protein